MPKNPNLGTRYVCFRCGTKFYDLQRPAALCPECGADQVDGPSATPAKKLPRTSRSRKDTPEPEPDDSSDDVDDDDDDPLSLLGDDDDDDDDMGDDEDDD